MKIVFVASIIRHELLCVFFLFFCSKIIFDQKLFSYCWDKFDYPGFIVYLSCSLSFQASIESIGSDYSEDGDGLQPSVSAAGEIMVGLKYNSSEGQLEVQIHRAKDLIPADPKKNTTDP